MDLKSFLLQKSEDLIEIKLEGFAKETYLLFMSDVYGEQCTCNTYILFELFNGLKVESHCR